MKCPLCEEPLYYKEKKITVKVDYSKPARPADAVHVYSCNECPFVGFEYHNKYDTKLELCISRTKRKFSW